MDGLLNSKHEVMPGLLELKKAYEPIGMSYKDGVLSIENRYDFINLEDHVYLPYKLEEFSDNENDHVLARLAQYDEDGRPINGDGVHERYEPRRPEHARHSHEKRGGYAPDRHPSHNKPSRGWFGGSRREPEHDLERGEKREYRRDDRRDRR